MKKLTMVVLVLTVACRSNSAPGASPQPARGSSETGAASAQAAAKAYLDAAKSGDLQAMSAVWGTAKGSVRETMDRNQIEKQETIVMGLLCRPDYRISGESAGEAGGRQVRAEVTRAGKSVAITLVTVKGPHSRWYVEDLPLNGDLPQRLQALCY